MQEKNAYAAKQDEINENKNVFRSDAYRIGR